MKLIALLALMLSACGLVEAVDDTVKETKQEIAPDPVPPKVVNLQIPDTGWIDARPPGMDTALASRIKCDTNPCILWAADGSCTIRDCRAEPDGSVIFRDGGAR